MGHDPGHARAPRAHGHHRDGQPRLLPAQGQPGRVDPAPATWALRGDLRDRRVSLINLIRHVGQSVRDLGKRTASTTT